MLYHQRQSQNKQSQKLSPVDGLVKFISHQQYRQQAHKNRQVVKITLVAADNDRNGIEKESAGHQPSKAVPQDEENPRIAQTEETRHEVAENVRVVPGQHVQAVQDMEPTRCKVIPIIFLAGVNIVSVICQIRHDLSGIHVVIVAAGRHQQPRRDSGNHHRQEQPAWLEIIVGFVHDFYGGLIAAEEFVRLETGQPLA